MSHSFRDVNWLPEQNKNEPRLHPGAHQNGSDISAVMREENMGFKSDPGPPPKHLRDGERSEDKETVANTWKTNTSVRLSCLSSIVVLVL